MRAAARVLERSFLCRNMSDYPPRFLNKALRSHNANKFIPFQTLTFFLLLKLTVIGLCTFDQHLNGRYIDYWVKYPLKFEDLLGRKPITCCNVNCFNKKIFWHSSRNYPDKTTVYFQGTIEKKAELRRSFLVDFKLVFPIADFCPLRGDFIISQVLLVSRRTIVMMCRVMPRFKIRQIINLFMKYQN